MLTNESGVCVGVAVIPMVKATVIRYRDRLYARSEDGMIFRGEIMKDFRAVPVHDVKRLEVSLSGDQ